jgi:anaerobic magnesium-protoporphyrin IX monomethyl ester cyclase
MPAPARVLLITPYGFQNMGVRLLSAVLRREGFDAPVLFMKGWRNNDLELPTEKEKRLLEELVRGLHPDVVGFGFGTPHLKVVTDLTRRVRAASPGSHLIWGGVHPTIVPEDCIPHADSVCVGEGELPLVDLARALSSGGDVAAIPNLWVRLPGGGVRKNPPRPLIADLDTLPHQQLPGARLHVIDNDKLTEGDPSVDNRLYRIMASRGCPFKCSFCYNSQYREIYAGLGRYHRVRRVEKVIEEIEAARAALPALVRIRFDDDSFVFPRAWIDEFCREYTKRIGLPFDILLNPMAAGAWMLSRLRDAGLVHVQVGIQTASREELERSYNRRGAGDDILGLARLLAALRIDVTYDVILDNPLASTSDKEAMLDLLLRLPRPYNLFLYSLNVFPRSETASKLMAAGLITEDDIEGRATKSYHQFRLTLDWPRPPEDTFFASLISMASKGFLPRALLRTLGESRVLRRHPTAIRWVAEAANAVKLAEVGLGMLRRGELSAFKLAEYASFKRRLIQ